ncbi:hypothetical protein B0T13DRAFT_457899 [Neurospora crassa]|nr:hypothetical protein B0T13DRAFT_457899 [Neurospora crassa]
MMPWFWARLLWCSHSICSLVGVKAEPPCYTTNLPRPFAPTSREVTHASRLYARQPEFGSNSNQVIVGYMYSQFTVWR